MKKIFVCLLLLMLAVPACAEENIPLFKDYYYGMSKADVQKKSGAIACQHENLLGSLCMTKPISFGNQQWEQVFLIEDNKLGAVLLAKDIDAQSLVAVMQTVTSNGYVLLSMSTGSKQFDLINTVHTKGKNSINAEMTKFEAEAQNAQELAYGFFEAEKVKPLIAKSDVISFGDFVAKAPVNLRSVEIKRTGDILSVQFLAPIAAIQDMRKKAGESKEKF